MWEITGLSPLRIEQVSNDISHVYKKRSHIDNTFLSFLVSGVISIMFKKTDQEKINTSEMFNEIHYKKKLKRSHFKTAAREKASMIKWDIPEMMP